MIVFSFLYGFVVKVNRSLSLKPSCVLLNSANYLCRYLFANASNSSDCLKAFSRSKSSVIVRCPEMQMPYFS